jgi:hypothetical protein
MKEPLLSLYNSFIIGELLVFALLLFIWAALAIRRQIKKLCWERPLV